MIFLWTCLASKQINEMRGNYPYSLVRITMLTEFTQYIDGDCRMIAYSRYLGRALILGP